MGIRHISLRNCRRRQICLVYEIFFCAIIPAHKHAEGNKYKHCYEAANDLNLI